MSDQLTPEQKAIAQGSEEGFREVMLKSSANQGSEVAALKKQINEQSDRWMKETKEKFEALDKVTGVVGTLEEKAIALERAQQALVHERHVAGVSIEARLNKNPDARHYLNGLVRKGLNVAIPDIQKKALGEDSSPGSTFLRNDIASIVYDSLPDYGIWKSLAVEPMGTKLEALPVDTADPIAQFLLTESSQSLTDDTNMTGSSSNLTAKLCGVYCTVSMQLLKDSEYDVSARLLTKFARAFSKRVDTAAFIGNGTADATNGGFTGLFNFATGVTAITTHTTVAKLTIADIIATQQAVDVEVNSRDSAKWWMSKFVQIGLLGMVDGNGRPIFLNALESPVPEGIGSIFGRPVVVGNICPAVGTAGTQVLAYGDANAFVVGLRQDFEFDFSDQVAFQNYKRAFRGIGRVGVLGRQASALAVLSTAAS